MKPIPESFLKRLSDLNLKCIPELRQKNLRNKDFALSAKILSTPSGGLLESPETDRPGRASKPEYTVTTVQRLRLRRDYGTATAQFYPNRLVGRPKNGNTTNTYKDQGEQISPNP